MKTVDRAKTTSDPHRAKPLRSTQDLNGISARNLKVHHDDLYQGYVKKANEIQERLNAMKEDIVKGRASGNSTYSELRALKDGETYAVNGIYLHEWYFDGLRSEETPAVAPAKAAPELTAALSAEFHSVDAFLKTFTQCAMAARGWTILAWNARSHKLCIYNCDAHNQGGVWGAIPVIVLDVYEHAYFMDFAADRSRYIESFWNSFDWQKANTLFTHARSIQF